MNNNNLTPIDKLLIICLLLPKDLQELFLEEILKSRGVINDSKNC